MFNLLPPEFLFRRAPQIHMGTGDFYPGPTLGGTTFAALPTSSGAPSGATVSACFARAISDPAGWTIEETIALFPYAGTTPPPILSDIRPPTDFTIQMRSSYTFASLAAFQSAVTTRRQSLNAPVPCLVSKGLRLSDLDTSFPSFSQAVQTWDILQGTTAVGAGVIARKSSTLTSQHWVIFDDTLLFDDLRCLQRSQGHSSIQAFFTEMQSLRDSSSVAFQHAVEECTHSADVPW